MQETTYQPVTTQTRSISGSSAATANAIGAGIHIVRLLATSDTHIAIATAPVATTSDMMLAAGIPEYFTIPEGAKVAGIQNSAAGTLYVTEMS